ncbi:ALG13 transferase, partial [Polypterus senegalus]
MCHESLQKDYMLLGVAAQPDTECFGIPLQIFRELGFEKLVLQIGRGLVRPEPCTFGDFTLEVFQYKDSIAEEIQRADLVISHAGSCLETLGAGKPLLVVVNDQLMDNHQLELARQLHRDGHLYYCTCKTLADTMKSMDLSALKPFLPGKTEEFAIFMDRIVGLEKVD